jgi:hypothetical protein
LELSTVLQERKRDPGKENWKKYHEGRNLTPWQVARLHGGEGS